MVALFYRLRRPRGDAWPVILGALGGLGLVGLGLFPGLANLPAALFSLRDEPGGRLITVLIFAVAVLWFIVVWNRAKLAHLAQQQDRLLRGLGLERVHWPESRATMDTATGSIWVVIPALNEADNLRQLLTRLPARLHDRPVQLLVVDDGSTDTTVSTSLDFGAVVLSLPVNGGGGLALRTGFDFALAQGAEWLVTMDADGQHDPGELSALVAPLAEGRADIVIGSRTLGQHTPASRSRALGVHFFNRLISFLLGQRISDCASGYRALSAAALRDLHLTQAQYHTAELIIDAAKRGQRIMDVPITIHRRGAGTSRKGRDLTYGAMFVRTIIKTWLR